MDRHRAELFVKNCTDYKGQPLLRQLCCHGALSGMAHIRRVVLDTLKPHKPNSIERVQDLRDPDGTSSVDISIYEIDHKVENATITIEGDAIDFDVVQSIIISAETC